MRAWPGIIPSLFRIEQISADAFLVQTTTPARFSIRTPHRRAFIEHEDDTRTPLETQKTAGMLSFTINPRTLLPGGSILRLE